MSHDEYEDKTVIAEISSLALDGKPNKEKPPACLVQYSGSSLGKRYTLDHAASVTIGRSPESTITIAESSVSRQHVQLTFADGKVFCEDLKSANGTFINDKKCEDGKVALKDQDMLRLGTILLKFFANNNLDGLIHDKIYRMATIDIGTQIFNKQYLLEALGLEFRQSKASQKDLAIIYFDLDFFKKVNDTYGHNAGDQILRDMATLVQSITRKEDIFARFGGEEFVIILPKTDDSTALELAERIRKTVENHVFNLDVQTSDGSKKVIPYKQTISSGVSLLSKDMQNFKDLLESADKKLYTSKHSGRNKVTI